MGTVSEGFYGLNGGFWAIEATTRNPMHLKIILRRLEERQASLNVLSFEEELVPVR
ncbi:hypothetical protein [Deinococcus sp. Arct2-2]|uniref:hypothetical protein n=1 Tax=Deinococcus sp. Arct2-2 TaxID=2568653 RepID=UPI001454E32A|nr:hypothetical protein [Deinococcus sp. Arct2-2]